MEELSLRSASWCCHGKAGEACLVRGRMQFTQYGSAAGQPHRGAGPQVGCPDLLDRAEAGRHVHCVPQKAAIQASIVKELDHRCGCE